eukprot:g33057.t1
MHRIESLDDRFAAQLRHLPPETRVAVVRAVCRELSASFPTLPPEIHTAVDQIDTASDDLRRSVIEAASVLDDRYLELLNSDAECGNEFRLSRAAAAVSSALGSDAIEECLYEAHFAFEDLGKLKSITERDANRRSALNDTVVVARGATLRRQMDNFANFAILLLIVGLVLLVAEIFIPSGGMILIAALVCIAGSIWCAYKTWWDSPVYWWSYIACVVVAIPSAVGGMLYIFPRTTMGKRVLLEPPSAEEVTGYDEDFERLSGMAGKRGKTVTLLNPGGLVLIEGERLHCVSSGMLIEEDIDVEVVGVQGNELVVRIASAVTELAADEPEPDDPFGDTTVPKKDIEESHLDFDAGITKSYPISTRALEAHYLAGGSVPNVIKSLIAAHRANLDLDWQTAQAIDLAGRDVLDAVRTSVYPKVIDCPDPKKKAGTLDAVAGDGIQLKARARVTVRTNIKQLIGGATEETVIARVGQGIVQAIGSTPSYKDVLENPDSISRIVLNQGLEKQTAYEIVSIDIADIDVGLNIGARLQADQAEADMRVAEAKAEQRRAAAKAREQEEVAHARGSSANTLRLAKNLPEHGVAVRVVCVDAHGIDRPRRDRLRIHEYPYLKLPLLGRLTRALVHREMLQTPPDLIHVQSHDMVDEGLWLADRFECPCILTVHEILPRNVRLQFVPGRKRRLIAVSAPVKTVLRDRLGLDDDDVTVIHCGVEADTARPLPAVLDPGHRPVIGVAGPLEIIKGLPFFLGAAQKVLAQKQNIEFLVTGAGPEEENLRRLAEELDIAEHVTFIPNLADFTEPLAAMDIFCLPSLQQGLGTIMLEAMAMGKPVIASGVGGVFTIIRDNETGLVVPPSNSSRLAERMLELLNDPVLARSIGEAGRRLVLEEFSTEKMIQRTLALYHDVVDSKQADRPVASGAAN